MFDGSETGENGDAATELARSKIETGKRFDGGSFSVHGGKYY